MREREGEGVGEGEGERGREANREADSVIFPQASTTRATSVQAAYGFGRAVAAVRYPSLRSGGAIAAIKAKRVDSE